VVALADDATAANGMSRLTSVSTSTPVEFARPSTSFSLKLADANDSATLAAVDALFAASILITGDNGNDLIDATARALNVSLQGNAGYDTLRGGSGNDDRNGQSEDCSGVLASGARRAAVSLSAINSSVHIRRVALRETDLSQKFSWEVGPHRLN
jgi:hypothetical protein